MPSRRDRRRLSAVEKNGQAQNDEEHHQRQTQQGRQGSDETQNSTYNRVIPKFVYLQLEEFRKDLKCPICLGIIRKTKTAMECLHRFCGECIDKSIRIGRKECPTCRSHLASRRSLRDDPNHDALVFALFGDIDNYEKEEFTLQEEERTRNKEFQASYSKISERQFEARRGNKQPRRRRNARRRRDEWEREYERTYGNEEHELGTRGTQTSLANGIRAAQTSPANSNDTRGENEAEVPQEGEAIFSGFYSEVPPSVDEEMPQEGEAISSGSQPEKPPSGHEEVLEEGESLSSGSDNEDISLVPHPEIEDEDNNNTRKARRMQRIMEHFRSLDETGDLEIHLLLVPADKETTPALKWPLMSVPAKFTVDKLCKLVSQESPLAANEVEILVVKAEINMGEGANPSFSKDDLKLLEDGHKTLGEALDGHPLLRKEYTLAFRKKETVN
ncbi:hypothetical protein ACFE04_019334 [Oxalis oulophora]